MDLISGRTRGLSASAARALLRGCSWVYGMATAGRNRCFDWGVRKVKRSGVPAVSIGNLTTGGTGKTPLVATVVRILQEQGQRPGIVSRGYRADNSGANDEKHVLERLCPAVPHFQNPDRVVAAERLIAEHHVSCIVLDDAFQHRRIARDLDIVVIDATNPFGHDYFLPRGLLRESVTALRRADAMLITRYDQVSMETLQEIEARVRQVAQQLTGRIAYVSFSPTNLLGTDGIPQTLEKIAGRRAALMTALGNPAGFRATCERTGAEIVCEKLFPDHHHYSAADLRDVQNLAAEQDAEFVLTTLKDLVKISPELLSLDLGSKSAHIPFLAVEISTLFDSDEGEQLMRQLLKQAIQ